MIKVQNLNKFYNKNKSNQIHVINDVSLELPSQGLVAFLGASGSGKTTLLNVIGGLDKGTGTISYDSFEMKNYDMSKIDKFRNEHFGYVFQGYNLLLTETVYDNLKIALELINIYEPQEINSRIEYALKSVGMYKYRKKRASQLSGGQQQRVAIARALVKHCKVIIADEPTGNLDSANAVEVMNILKSISKKTLVLLVTHNETLANFYSDYIYRIEDGKIVSQQENVSNAVLETSNDNVIYLKDMPLTESKSERIGVKLYADADKSIELEIVERNNTYYIRSNKTIRLIESSNLKLVNEHYKPVEKTSVAEGEYDDSFFNNAVKKRNVWQDFWANLKRSFFAFMQPTKKVKMIYTSLVMLGVLFAICAISISNAVKVDRGSINADNAYYTLNNGNRYYLFDGAEEIRKGLQNGDISSVQIANERYVSFSKKLNFVEEKEYSADYKRLYYNKDVNDLVLGREPKGYEIAISEALADELMEQFDGFCESYEDLFHLTVDDGGSKVVGIVENPYKMVYISEQAYLDNLTSWIYVDNDYIRYYSYEKQYDSYEIVAGRDLTDEDYNTTNILISDKFPGYESVIGMDIGTGVVIGVYRLKGIDGNPNEIIINVDYTDVPMGYYKYSYKIEDYLLIDGRQPEKDNECLVSIYNQIQIGEKFDGYEVVGRYNASTELLCAKVLLSTSVLSIDEYSSKVFLVNEEESFLQTVNGKFDLMTMYDNEFYNKKDSNNEKMAIFMVLGVVCLIATSIMVLFLMRSKMINDIYNIGVYRSLGANKLKIYLKYLTDILVMVTFTALITYLLVMFIYLTGIRSINDYFMLELFSRELTVPISGIGVLYLVNVVFGLLPIFTLLRKTPAEIISKYDI